MLAAPLAIGVLLAAAACGSTDSDAGPAPAPDSPTTTTTTPTSTPTPSATPTAKPLSPFEDEPTVKVMREWAVILGKGVPKGDLGGLSKVMSGQALTATVDSFNEDYGNAWPGPQPFTPVRVKTTGRSGTIDFCFQTRGWSQDPKTHAPVASKREVQAARFTFNKRSSGWLITEAEGSSIDCSAVQVKGVAW